MVTRIELFGGRCAGCGHRFRAAPPDGMPPGSPFGTRIRSLLLYLHHSHHAGFERLSRMMDELFGLSISEGAIAGAFRRAAGAMTAACAAIREKLKAARVIASDETTARIDGAGHWHWVFVSAKAVLHTIAPRRAKAVTEAVLGGHRPDVWVSDRYAGQQDLASVHQVCLAHLLRDVQYAIDCGDTVFAPRLRELLRWAIRIGRRRDALRPASLAAYHARAERRLDALVATPAAHPAGRALQTAVKAWRTKFFVFLDDPGGASHQQRLRAGNPPLRGVPQGHRRLPLGLGCRDPRRLPLGMGCRDPRRLPLRHRHRPPPRPNRAAGHQPHPRRNLRALHRLLTARRVSSY